MEVGGDWWNGVVVCGQEGLRGIESEKLLVSCVYLL